MSTFRVNFYWTTANKSQIKYQIVYKATDNSHGIQFK